MTRAGAPWPKRVAAAVVVWFLVCAVALVLGMSPQPVLVAVLVAAGAAVVVLYADASAAAASNRWAVEDVDPTRQPGEDARLAMLTRVVGSHLDSREAGDQLHDQLLQLLDRRLVARHGVSLRADPERALALLGPGLAGFARQRPPYPRLTIEHIDVLVSRIEEL